MIHSSPPVNVTVSRDLGFGVYDFRPDVVPGIPMYVDDPSAPGGRRFNPLAVSVRTRSNKARLGETSFEGFHYFKWILQSNELSELQSESALRDVWKHSTCLITPILTGVRRNGHTRFKWQVASSKRLWTFAGYASAGTRWWTTRTFGSGFSPLYQIGGARSLQLVLKIGF